MVNGRVHILHSLPKRSFIIRTYGLSPRQVWQRIGNSASSQFCRLYVFVVFDIDMLTSKLVFFKFCIKLKSKSACFFLVSPSYGLILVKTNYRYIDKQKPNTTPAALFLLGELIQSKIVHNFSFSFKF